MRIIRSLLILIKMIAIIRCARSDKKLEKQNPIIILVDLLTVNKGVINQEL